jgi:DNA invertase Pin-like site-specific DNA recombinase
LPENVRAQFAECGRRGGSAKSKAKREASASNGKLGGRPAKIDDETAELIEEMLLEGKPKTEIARAIGVHRATLARHLAR